MGDRCRENLYQYITSHPGQLSLAIRPWVDAMSIYHLAVVCSWGGYRKIEDRKYWKDSARLYLLQLRTRHKKEQKLLRYSQAYNILENLLMPL